VSNDKEKIDTRELCWYCCEPFPEGENAFTHAVNRHRGQAFECLLCVPEHTNGGIGRLFPLKSSLDRHLEREHLRDPRRSQGDLACYRAPDDVRAVKCTLCDVTFSCVGERELRRHFEDVHPGDDFHAGLLEWHCRVCPEEDFDDEEEQLEHARKVHGFENVNGHAIIPEPTSFTPPPEESQEKGAEEEQIADVEQQKVEVDQNQQQDAVQEQEITDQASIEVSHEEIIHNVEEVAVQPDADEGEGEDAMVADSSVADNLEGEGVQ